MIPGPFTTEDYEAVLACARAARKDGTRARLAAFEYLRRSPGYLTLPQAAKTGKCGKSAIFDATLIVEETIKRKREERAKARQYGGKSVSATLSRNSIPTPKKERSLESSNGLPGTTQGAENTNN
jgi:hypothetical protein